MGCKKVIKGIMNSLGPNSSASGTTNTINTAVAIDTAVPPEGLSISEALPTFRTDNREIPKGFILTYTAPRSAKHYTSPYPERTFIKALLNPEWLNPIDPSKLTGEEKEDYERRLNTTPFRSLTLSEEDTRNQIREISQKAYRMEKLYTHELEKEIEKNRTNIDEGNATDSQLLYNDLSALSRAQSTFLDKGEYNELKNDFVFVHFESENLEEFKEVRKKLVEPKLSPLELHQAKSDIKLRKSNRLLESLSSSNRNEPPLLE